MDTFHRVKPIEICRFHRQFLAPCIFAVALAFFSQTATPAAVTPAKTNSDLTVEEAIELAYAHNLDLRNAALDLQSAKMSYDGAWDTMYMPNVTFGAGWNSAAYTLGTIPGTPARVAADQNVNRGYPTSTASLTLGSYKLFNFWRDRMAFDNSKLSYDLAVLGYTETRRQKRSDVINAYFKARVDQEKRDIASHSLEMAHAILNLIKSREAIGKATKDEVNSSTTDLLTAKINLGNADKLLGDDIAALNLLLNAVPDQKFHLISDLKYYPVKINAAEAFQIYKQSGPGARSTKNALRSAELGVESAERDRLPLPTITFNGISFTYGNNYAAGSNQLGGSTPAGQINIEASASMSIPLLGGAAGFLGSRTVAVARINRDKAEISAMLTTRGAESSLERDIANLKNIETTIKDQKDTYENNTKLLDSLFEQMSKAAVTRLELRDAILQARTSETTYWDTLLSHLSAKMALAIFLGVDQLPGDKML